jgi:membrane protein
LTFSERRDAAIGWAKLQYRRYYEAQIPTRAAALAYHTLLAIVPIIGLLFWYLVHIGVTNRWLRLTKTYILSQFNVDAEGRVEDTFKHLTSIIQHGGWNWVGIPVLIYTTWMLLHRFNESLDLVLGTATKEPHVKHKLSIVVVRRTLVMLGLPVALTLSVVVTTWIREDSWLHYLTEIKLVGSYVLLAFAWSVDIFVLFTVYYVVPTRTPPWREALKAAVVAGVLSELTRNIFSLYNVYAVSVHKIYGVLAAIPLFILWVQLAWIVVLGAALIIRYPDPPAESDSYSR